MAERLLAADRRELDLKEKVHNLQKAEKEMELALQEQKRLNDDLRQELKDQDDLIGKIHNHSIGQKCGFFLLKLNFGCHVFLRSLFP